MFDFLKSLQKKLSSTQEQKSCSFPYATNLPVGFGNYLHNHGDYELLISHYIYFYRNCGPLAHAIDFISDNIAAIDPHVWDTESKVFIENHPVLELLKAPNADVTYREFIKSLINFYIIGGNVYMMVSGNVDRPPLELFSIPPQWVTPYAGFQEFVEWYQYNTREGMIKFSRSEIDKKFRFFNESLDLEMYHVRDFNPHAAYFRILGMSRLQPISLEIEQYINGSIHNNAILSNGSRTTGVFTPTDIVDRDQMRRLQEQIREIYSGPQNAGRPLFLEGPFQFQQMALTARDMDYSKLKESVTEAIYNRLNIPLAAVQSNSLSLANMETAKVDFYDRAIMPLASFVFSELTRFLMGRYKNSENLEITYDINEIESLQPRTLSVTKRKRELFILSNNELRTEIGMEEVEGGDVVYQPSNWVPSGTDVDTEDNIKPKPQQQEEERIQPEPPTGPEKLTSKNARENFFKIMKNQIDKEGNRVWNDDEIKEFADGADLK